MDPPMMMVGDVQVECLAQREREVVMSGSSPSLQNHKEKSMCWNVQWKCEQEDWMDDSTNVLVGRDVHGSWGMDGGWGI
jgi:hypothetical protein